VFSLKSFYAWTRSC